MEEKEILDENLEKGLNENSSSDVNSNQQGNEVENLNTAQKSSLPPKKQKNNNRTTSMVLGIVFFSVAFAFAIGAAILYLSVYASVDPEQGNLNAALALLSFILLYGYFTYIPAFIFSIVGIVMSAVGLKSDIKKHRTVCKVFLSLSVVLLVSLVLALVVALILSGAGT